jgi:hypothetical protein
LLGNSPAKPAARAPNDERLILEMEFHDRPPPCENANLDNLTFIPGSSLDLSIPRREPKQ